MRYIIGIKNKEGRGSAHYELIWEIPVQSMIISEAKYYQAIFKEEE
jgi:hypothetical protein